MTTTMNRSDRRAYAKRTKNKSIAIKGIASFGIATMLLGAGAGMASATEQTRGDGFTLSAEAHPIFGQYMDGTSGVEKMTGEITSLTMENQAGFEAAGGVIDLADSLAKTNKSLADGSWNAIGLNVSIDEAKASTITSANRMNVYGYKIIAGDAMGGNITTKEQLASSTHKQGDVLNWNEFNEVEYVNNDTSATNLNVDEDGLLRAATAYPVTSSYEGGTDNGEGVSNFRATVVNERYSDGDSAKRVADATLDGTQQGLNPDTTVNCITSDCVIPLTVVAFGSFGDDPSGEKIPTFAIALNDTSFVHAKTTWSAGKTPVYTKANPFVQADGTKVWLNPSKGVDGDGFFDKSAAMVKWQFSDLLASDIANQKNIPIGTANLEELYFSNGSSIARAKWNIANTVGSEVNYKDYVVNPSNNQEALVTFESAVDTWTYGTSETELVTGLKWSNGDGISYEVVSAESGLLTIKVNTAFDLSDLIFQSSAELDAGVSVYLPWYQRILTPSYRVAYEVAPPVVIEKDPTALPDFVSGKHGQPVIIDPIANDKTSDASWTVNVSSLRIKDLVDAKFKKTVTVEGQGTFEVQADGKVKFTGVDSFSGKTTALTYQWDEVKNEIVDGVNEGLLGKTASSTLQAEIVKTEIPVIPEETPDETPEETPENTPDKSTIPNVTPEDTPDKSTITKDEPTNNGGGDEVVENNDGGGQDLEFESDGSGQDLAESGVIQVFGKIAKALTLLGAGGIVTLISQALISRTRKNRETSTNE